MPEVTITPTSNDVVHVRREQVTVAANTTLTESDAGKDYNVGTDALVITLPLIEEDNLGMEFLFRNTGAEGNNIITLSPNASDGIYGTLSKSAGSNADATTADGLVLEASGVADKDLINTKATANRGDWVRLRAVSTTKWFIEGGLGIWASQA